MLEWFKKNWFYLLLFVIIGLLICGLLFTGWSVFEAQGYVKKLDQSVRDRDKYITQLESDNQQFRDDIAGLAETVRKTRENYSELDRNYKRLRINNDKIMEAERRRQEEFREAIRILDSARHN